MLVQKSGTKPPRFSKIFQIFTMFPRLFALLFDMKFFHLCLPSTQAPLVTAIGGPLPRAILGQKKTVQPDSFRNRAARPKFVIYLGFTW